MAITYANIQNEVAGIVRYSMSDAAQAALVNQWIRLTVQDMNSRGEWYWTVDRQVVQTVADKSAGTVSVAAGGQTVTGSSTAFAAVDVGKYIKFSTANDWYKITAVTPTTSLSIEAPYISTSALSGGTYLIRKFFYSLSSTADQILSVRQANTPRKITAMNYRDFDLHIPDGQSTGKAIEYLPYGMDSSGNLVFTPYPWPDEIYNLEIRFKKKTVDFTDASQQPEIPEKWRSVLIDGAQARALAHTQTGPDFQKAIAKERAYEAGIKRMEAAARQAPDYAPVLQSRETIISPIGGPLLPENYDAKGR